jgi:zinc/manganese transport system ATP-binding protein
MGLWARCGLFGAIARRELTKVEGAIAAVGLEGFELRAISTLSGGQLQRMLFARLLLQDAAIILLDEPFTAIDSKTVSDLLDLVARWSSEKRTVLAVLHDEELVRAHFPQTLLLAREKIAWGETSDVLTPQNLLKARTMVEAFDRGAPPCAHAA